MTAPDDHESTSPSSEESAQPDVPEVAPTPEAPEAPAATEAPAAPAAPAADEPPPVDPPAESSAPASAPAPVPSAAPAPGPRPVPRPPAGARPTPPRRPAAATQPPPETAAPTGPDTSALAREAATWGRVEDDGTVHVRTADGERVVGQYAAGSPAEALDFFVRRFVALSADATLLEDRVASGATSPEQATEQVKALRGQLTDAAAVGDLASLGARLDALEPAIAEQREQRRAERAKVKEEARVAKDKLVVRAEKIAAGRDWRNGANRLRELLEEWKALPRLDRAADDELWKRFSAARTAYTRSRKTHFSEMDEQRAGAAVVKERLITEAEKLSASTEWGPTSGRYRDLMAQWKEAGAAPKAEDEALWQRFRGAQDVFFSARDEANRAENEEFARNAEVKDGLIVELEALLPVRNLSQTKRAFRDLADRWEAAGKVPRERMQELEGRLRTVEQAVRSAEDAQWSRTDPEKTARADDMVAKLERAVAGLESDLEAARSRGDDKRTAQLESDLAGRRTFLDAARRTASDLG